MRTGLFPGSFDPVTEGHLDLIRRASALFDRLFVAVMVNHEKQTLFTREERAEMLRIVTSGLEGVEIVTHAGLLADYAEELGADFLIKGVRNLSDFENEFQMAVLNKTLSPKLETVFLPSDPRHIAISSSAVKSIAAGGGDLHGFVPEEVRQRVIDRVYETYKMR